MIFGVYEFRSFAKIPAEVTVDHLTILFEITSSPHLGTC